MWAARGRSPQTELPKSAHFSLRLFPRWKPRRRPTAIARLICGLALVGWRILHPAFRASIIRWRTLARRASEGALDSAQVFRPRCGFWPKPSEIHRYSRRVRLNHPRWRVGLVWLDASILCNLTIKARLPYRMRQSMTPLEFISLRRFGWERPVWCAAVAGLPRCISTPETAKHRVFVFLNSDVLPDNMLTNFALDDAFFSWCVL